MDAVTLDQLNVFATIVDTGSFAAAARRLNRRQSAITYAVQKLEDQSGVQLFDRATYRPSLTEAGRVLLPRARRIVASMAEYRAQAVGLRGGVEARVSLMMDQFASFAPAAGVFREFQTIFPFVQIHVSTRSSNVAEALMDGQIDIGVFPLMAPIDAACEVNYCGRIELVAVAAPSHPLAALAGPIEPEQLYDYVQIVARRFGRPAADRDHGVHAANCWYVDGLDSKLSLLLEGLGWGSMPRYIVAPALANHRLVELHPVRWEGASQMPRLPCVVACRKGVLLGPAGRWLFQHLSEVSWS